MPSSWILYENVEAVEQAVVMFHTYKYPQGPGCWLVGVTVGVATTPITVSEKATCVATPPAVADAVIVLVVPRVAGFW